MSNYKDRAKKRSKVVAAESDRFKLHVEDNFIRVLPTPPSGEDTEDDTFTEVRMHSDIGPDGRFLRCGRSAYDPTEGSCYTCDKKIPQLIAAGHGETAKKAKSKWNLCLQVAAGEETDEGIKPTGPHFYMVGGKLGKALLSTLSSSKRDYADPLKGYWFTINRQGEGLNTTYGSPIPDEESSKIPKRFVEVLKPFNQLAEMPQYSEQDHKDAWRGIKRSDAAAAGPGRRAGVLADDDDEDEVEAPPVRKPVKRAAVVEDEEDEAPPAKAKKRAAVVADEDEDEVPVRKPAKRAAVVEDEDEDEAPPTKAKKRAPIVEPDDDDEDMEEAPRKPASKKPVAAVQDDEEDEDEGRPVKKAAVQVSNKKSAAPPPDEDEEDEDEGPPVKAAAKKSSAKAVAPAKKAATKKVAAVEADDDDPWPEDEDAEEDE